MSYPPSGSGAPPPDWGPPPPSWHPPGSPHPPQQPPLYPQPGQYQPGGYEQAGFGYPPPPPGQYPPAGVYPPPGKPRRGGRAVLFSIIGIVVGVALISCVGFAATRLLGGDGLGLLAGGAPRVGDCLDDPLGEDRLSGRLGDEFKVVGCDSPEAAFQVTAIDTSPSGPPTDQNLLSLAADLGCGFDTVLWVEVVPPGRLTWVACATEFALDRPVVGDCLDDSEEFVVVPCDDPTAVERVTYASVDDLPRDADQSSVKALLERCPDPDTEYIYTSWEADGEPVLWMLCLEPLYDPIEDLRVGDCLSDDPDYFVVVGCDSQDAFERIIGAATGLTDTADTRDDVDEVARQQCGEPGSWFYYDGWTGEPGTPVDWIICVEEV